MINPHERHTSAAAVPKWVSKIAAPPQSQELKGVEPRAVHKILYSLGVDVDPEGAVKQ